MQQKTIQHQSRQISFLYDETIAWQQQDEDMLQAYLKLHDREEWLNTEGSNIMPIASELDSKVEETRAMLQKISKQLKKLSTEADGFFVFEMQKQKKAESLSLKTQKIGNKLQAYGELLNDVADEIHEFSDRKFKYLNIMEDYKQWLEFSGIMHAHSKNCETNSIDIASFSKEEESFKCYISVHKDQNANTFYIADDVIENYNTLTLETKIEYATWDEFLKRLALINAISMSPDQSFNTSAN